MKSKKVEEGRHEYSYYERCVSEVEGLREFLLLRGFGVECRTEGTANTAIMLLRAFFDSVEPERFLIQAADGEWCGEGELPEISEGPGPGGLPHRGPEQLFLGFNDE